VLNIMALLVLFCLVLCTQAAVQTKQCNMPSYFYDAGRVQGVAMTLSYESLVVSGVTTPQKLTVTFQNDQSYFYTESAPGAGPQDLCDITSWNLTPFKVFGYARVDTPAFPASYNMFHWYTVPVTEINSWTPANAKWSTCLTTHPAGPVFPDGANPAAPECVPFMGLHWAIPSMDFLVGDNVAEIWGSFNEKVTFTEPLVPTSKFQSLAAKPAGSRTDTMALHLPRVPQQTGFYPASLTLGVTTVDPVDPLKNIQTFEFSNWVHLVGLDAPPAPTPEPVTPEPCDCSGAMSVSFSCALMVLSFIAVLLQ